MCLHVNVHMHGEEILTSHVTHMTRTTYVYLFNITTNMRVFDYKQVTVHYWCHKY